jgi:hypothetical protein
VVSLFFATEWDRRRTKKTAKPDAAARFAVSLILLEAWDGIVSIGFFIQGRLDC